MDTLRLASELRRVDMMLAGVAELRQMCINQEIQKRAAPKRQVFSESMQVLGPEQQQRWVFRPHSLSDSVDSDDESTSEDYLVLGSWFILKQMGDHNNNNNNNEQFNLYYYY